MKKNGFLFVLIILLIIFSANVESVSVGVSPGTINFKNMLKNGYAERIITVTVATEEDVLVSASLRGEIKDWINLSTNNFTVSKNKPYELKVTAQPPPDIANGDYSGYLRITTEGLGDIGIGQMGSIVKAAIDVIININIIDVEIIECRASDFSVQSAEKGDPIEFKVKVTNDGNTRLYPSIKIDIWDQEQLNIVKFVDFKDEMVLPTTTKYITINVPSDNLEVDQYWAEIEAEECFASDLLTFDVMQPGSLTANGVLEQITNKLYTNVDEKVPIYSIFRNTGEKTVSAKFKGNVQFKNNIIEILESEEIEVPTGSTYNFTVFFTPREEGRYIISGRIFYDKKRTYELSSALNAKAIKKDYIKTLIYIIIIIVIAFLIYKIKKEKRRLRF